MKKSNGQPMKKLGLLGGISWVSTIDYYRYINTEINARLGGLNYAECLIYSLNFADIHERQWDHTTELMYDACKHLENAGAQAIVLCANTAHYAAAELQSRIDLPIIHVVDALAETIHQQGLVKLGLLGTSFTMEMKFYRQALADKGIGTIIPPLQATRDYIQHTLKDELGKGIIKEETRQAYLAIIHEMIGRGAEGIILGCTELPLLINQQDVPVPVFDTTKIHATAAVDFSLFS